MRGNLSRALVAVWAVLSIVPAAGLGASRTPIASVANTSGISALHGWIVWDTNTGTQSEAVYHLMAWHAGKVIELNAHPRPLPFDADLGTDLDGRVVAVFSRCSRYNPDVFDYGPMLQGGCRIRIYDLASQTERAAGEPTAPGYSEVTPAIWRGRLAYQQFRTLAGHHPPKRKVAQLWLWSPRTGRRVHLPHGPVGYDEGWANSIDLDDDLVAYIWDTQDDGGHVLDLRAVTADGRSVRLSSGGYGDAGGGAFPETPNLVGRRVWFGYLTFDGVNVWHSWIDRSSGTRLATRQASIRGRQVDYARDGSTGYGLFLSGSATNNECSADAPCTIERVPDPPKLTGGA